MAIIFNKIQISAIHTDFKPENKGRRYYAEVTLKNILNDKYIRFNVRRHMFVDTEFELLRVFHEFIKVGCSFDNCFDRFCEIQELDVTTKHAKKKWRQAEHYAKMFKYLCDDSPMWMNTELEKALSIAA